MPQSLFEQLTLAVAHYGRRFGHSVPQFAIQQLEPKELLARIERALSEKSPVTEWQVENPTDVVMDRPAQEEQPAETPAIGAPTSTTKRTGIISRTMGAAYSRKDSGTLSFAYFRTPDGKPPKKDPDSKK